MQIEKKNQIAINEFFEAFGEETARQYSETIVDMIALISEQDSGMNYKHDAVTKLKDLNRLVLQLGATKKVEVPGFNFADQKN